MKYYKVNFCIVPMSEDAADILSALIAETGFETFETKEDGLTGYVQRTLWNEEEVQNLTNFFPMPDTSITYSVEEAPDENWNAEWEANGFEPIVVEDVLCIHDTKHEAPQKCKYEILINPRMAFGSGTHPTTRQILKFLTETNLQGKRVMDAGCGTGVLGILCAMRGASHVLGYDIDEWSVENSEVNFGLNGLLPLCEIRHGDSDVITHEDNYDLVIANINRNILLGDLPRFAHALKSGGELILSGFYSAEIDIMSAAAEELKLHTIHTQSEDDWAMMVFEKQ